MGLIGGLVATTKKLPLILLTFFTVLRMQSVPTSALPLTSSVPTRFKCCVCHLSHTFAPLPR